MVYCVHDPDDGTQCDALTMQSEMLMFTVAVLDSNCIPMSSRRLVDLEILEPTHVERWILDHPEVLGDQISVVTTQYDKWWSNSGDLAKERQNILGLASSGSPSSSSSSGIPIPEFTCRPSPTPRWSQDQQRHVGRPVYRKRTALLGPLLGCSYGTHSLDHSRNSVNSTTRYRGRLLLQFCK